MNKDIGGPINKVDQILESVASNEKLQSIGREAKWLAIALSILSIFGQQFILNLDKVKKLYAPLVNVLKPGSASIEDYLTIGKTLMISAPLVLVIAVLYVFVKGKEERSEGIAPVHYFVGFLLLYLAAKFGNAMGFANVTTAGPRGGTPFAVFFNVLFDYLNSYGLILFLSSGIVGWFIGRAWRKLANN